MFVSFANESTKGCSTREEILSPDFQCFGLCIRILIRGTNEVVGVREGSHRPAEVLVIIRGNACICNIVDLAEGAPEGVTAL